MVQEKENPLVRIFKYEVSFLQTYQVLKITRKGVFHFEDHESRDEKLSFLRLASMGIKKRFLKEKEYSVLEKHCLKKTL